MSSLSEHFALRIVGLRDGQIAILKEIWPDVIIRPHFRDRHRPVCVIEFLAGRDYTWLGPFLAEINPAKDDCDFFLSIVGDWESTPHEMRVPGFVLELIRELPVDRVVFSYTL